ncbi:MAG: GNAT family N-acetyltransferase [Gaiella sp.]
MSTVITRERPDSPDAVALIGELDAVLQPLYPSESRHGFSVAKLLAEDVAFFVIRHDAVPAGCGGVQLVGAEYAEVKRMYVRPEFRGLGLGKSLLEHLAEHVRLRGITLLRLETGIHQHAAIALYERAGFRSIPPFGPYRPDPLSVCLEKHIGEGCWRATASGRAARC